MVEITATANTCGGGDAQQGAPAEPRKKRAVG